MSRRTVVIHGHPRPEASVANRLIVERLRREQGIEIRTLAELYPDQVIDAVAEQAALVTADTVVLQFPFYWYSVPGLLKNWIDTTLAYGFAFGSGGDKLHGKTLIVSTTIGGPQEAYRRDGYNTFETRELLRPLQQTAILTGMQYVEPVATHRMIYIPGIYNVLEEVQERARDHAERLVARIADPGPTVRP